jgi:hypothetical protein
MTDDEIIAQVSAVFGAVPRPEHFTQHPGCDECAEHDGVLQSHSRQTLSMAEVGSAAWNPITMCTPEAFRYWAPALIRICLEPEDPIYGWYGEQLIGSDLRRDGPRNERWLACTDEERQCLSRFLEHVIDTRAPLVDAYDLEPEVFDAFTIWSERAA